MGIAYVKQSLVKIDPSISSNVCLLKHKGLISQPVRDGLGILSLYTSVIRGFESASTFEADPVTQIKPMLA